MPIRFIGGGNQSTKRKSPTCHKSLTNSYHIMLYRVHLTLVVIGTHYIGSYKSYRLMKIKRENPYAIPKYPDFLSYWTNFDTIYFQLYCFKKRKKRKSTNEGKTFISDLFYSLVHSQHKFM